MSTPLDVYITVMTSRDREPSEVGRSDQVTANLVELFRLDGVDVTDPAAARAALSGVLYAEALTKDDPTGHRMVGLCDSLARIAKEAER